jgi:hypothetical protein
LIGTWDYIGHFIYPIIAAQKLANFPDFHQATTKSNMNNPTTTCVWLMLMPLSYREVCHLLRPITIIHQLLLVRARAKFPFYPPMFILIKCVIARTRTIKSIPTIAPVAGVVMLIPPIHFSLGSGQLFWIFQFIYWRCRQSFSGRRFCRNFRRS